MKRTAIGIATAALAACAGAPPPAPQVPRAESYTTTPVDLAAGGAAAAQRFVAGSEMPALWWTLFRSSALDALVRQALQASPTIERASARLRQAQQDLDARSGATGTPSVDASLRANHVDLDPAAVGARGLPLQTPFALYLATVGVSYSVDLFGATRNELAALASEVGRQRFDLEAARLMLAGNVVTAAIREAQLREQIAHSEAIVALQAEQLAIAERLQQLGTAAASEVAARQLDLARARATLPDLRRQLEQVRHRLAVYTGQAPGAAQLPAMQLADLELPVELPLSLPSELARQRPDIRAAEALLQQAGARVGVATANLYPQLTLSATVGSIGSSHGADLFAAGSGLALLGATLAQPIFHGGELQARRRSAIAAYEQAGAAYREVVLQGLRDVADVLRALEADGRRLRERSEALAQAQRLHDIAAGRYQAGGLSRLALLDAQRTLQTARLEHAQAAADRLADSAALLQALGGGWWKDAPHDAAR